MLNPQMRKYNYYKLSETVNYYGEETIEKVKAGEIKIAINLTNKSVSDNILYTDAQFIGTTLDKKVDDTFYIDYEGKLLKVKYVVKGQRYNIVYLVGVE